MERRRKDRRDAAKEIALFIINQQKLNAKFDLALFGNENENGMVKDVKEMVAVFNSVGGFNRVSVLILKGIIVIGGAITGVYIIVEFFKKIGK